MIILNNKKNLTLLCFWLMIGIGSHAQQVLFERPFAPAETFTKPSERPYRDDICLNGSWQFSPRTDARSLSQEQLLDPGLPKNFLWETTALKVPSPWNVNSFAREPGGGDFVCYPSYPKAWDTVKAGWLMRKFSLKKQWAGKRLILHFDAVAGYAQVFINKQKAGSNFDVFLPFDIDITSKVSENGDNEILVWIADANLFNQPGKYGRRIHVGGSFWGQHIIGIWQDVHLLVKPQAYVKSTFIRPLVTADELYIDATIINESKKTQQFELSATIFPWINLAGATAAEAPEPKWKLDKEVFAFSPKKITLAAGEEKTVSLKINSKGRLKLWMPESPALYAAVVTLAHGSEITDRQFNRFGWREYEMKGDKFYLNGKRIILKGDSWHFMGVPQMTRRYAWAWFQMLRDAHANAVRLHAQPYPAFYLDMADEMGIFVLDETGLWASDGGPKEDAEAYWTNAADHVKRFILRDRNHPAVFGWSVCNENIPVTVHVHRSPENLVQKQLSEINRWIAIARQTDPTRNWISGDGETGKPTDLPVIIGHYGDENAYKDWSSKGKLWGIGESGMAYYGTPRQTAAFNGSRSYVSQEGRMEGVAEEAIHILNLQKKYDASYRAVFNIVWYGLKPLEFGMKDTTLAPRLSDGIFFGPFREGKPGMQPERLGPYTSTLNPGYDPSLPLYRTWPLFDAIKASFLNNEILPEQTKPVSALPNDPATKKYASTVLLSADTARKLSLMLEDQGLDLVTPPTIADTAFILIDGLHPPADTASVSFVQTTLEKGGTIFILGLSPESLPLVNRYLPSPATIVTRAAGSFITGEPDPVLHGLGNADFYFSETSARPLSNYGLTGNFPGRSKILLSACNTNWRTWNNRPEYAKTIAVLRSEREAKPQGGVLVAGHSGKGNIYVFSIDPFMLSKVSDSLLKKLLENLGLVFRKSGAGNLPAVDADGILQRAMIYDSFPVFDRRTGTQAGHSQYAEAVKGIFNFEKLKPGSGDIIYMGFWLYSARSLLNLLAEPDLPVLNMNISNGRFLQAYLNGKPLESIKALPLEKGWNHILVSFDRRPNRPVSIRFDCNNNEFLDELRSKAAD